jgi:sugar lactone lactonase YvrE
MLKMPISDAKAEETNDMPLIWASTPYKLNEGNIQWLEDSKSPREVEWYDEKAQIEYERCVQLVYLSWTAFMSRSKVQKGSSICQKLNLSVLSKGNRRVRMQGLDKGKVLISMPQNYPPTIPNTSSKKGQLVNSMMKEHLSWSSRTDL